MNYWEERSTRQLKDDLTKADMLLRQIKSGYEDAAESITKEMSALFGRYTDENGLSYVKAMELLDGAEYRTWRMGMKEYLNLIEKFQSTE